MVLLLMRHAKSSWDDEGLADYDRPLNKRGQRTVPKMAAHLEKCRLLPDRIVTSNALRARQTAQLLGEHFTVVPEVREDLYLAGADVWRYVLAEQPRSNCLLMIGHNPGLEDLLADLTGKHHRLPTAAIAMFEVSAGDGPITPDSLTLQTIWRPKELEQD